MCLNSQPNSDHTVLDPCTQFDLLVNTLYGPRPMKLQPILVCITRQPTSSSGNISSEKNQKRDSCLSSSGPTCQWRQQPSSVHGPGARDPPGAPSSFWREIWRQAAASFPPRPPPPAWFPGRQPLLLPQPQNPHQRAHTPRRNPRPEVLVQIQTLSEGSAVGDGGVRRVLRGREGDAGGEHLPRVPQAVSRSPPPPPPPFLGLLLLGWAVRLTRWDGYSWICRFKDSEDAPEPFYEMEMEAMRSRESTTMYVDFEHVMRFNDILQKAISEEYLRWDWSFFPILVWSGRFEIWESKGGSSGSVDWIWVWNSLGFMFWMVSKLEGRGEIGWAFCNFSVRLKSGQSTYFDWIFVEIDS